jgi:hypothetical protein
MRSMVEGGMRRPRPLRQRCALPPPRPGEDFWALPQRNNRFFIHRSPSQIVSTTGMVSGASTA